MADEELPLYRLAYNHDLNGWRYSKTFESYAAVREAMRLVEDLIGYQPAHMLRIETNGTIDKSWCIVP